jgi:PHD/YefM family antitoxin component YafN of YafNO toxin-antitoxin module
MLVDPHHHSKEQQALVRKEYTAGSTLGSTTGPATQMRQDHLPARTGRTRRFSKMSNKYKISTMGESRAIPEVAIQQVRAEWSDFLESVEGSPVPTLILSRNQPRAYAVSIGVYQAVEGDIQNLPVVELEPKANRKVDWTTVQPGQRVMIPSTAAALDVSVALRHVALHDVHVIVGWWTRPVLVFVQVDWVRTKLAAQS